jgi:hypothetical protein
MLITRYSKYLFLTQKDAFFTKYSLYQLIIVEKLFIHILHFSLMYTFNFMYFLQQYNQYLKI